MTEKSHLAKFAEFVIGDDNSELGIARAERDYALHCLEREIAICAKTTAAFLAHLQSGVLHGYALAETVCEKSGGLLWPVGWNTIGAHRVLFESRTGRPHWFDPTGKTQYPGIDLRAGFAPGKILFYQPRVTGDEPTREGRPGQGTVITPLRDYLSIHTSL